MSGDSAAHARFAGLRHAASGVTAGWNHVGAQVKFYSITIAEMRTAFARYGKEIYGWSPR